MVDDDFEIAVILNRKEIRVLLTCVQHIWNCQEDVSFFEGDVKSEAVRLDLIKKLEKVNFPDVVES